MFVCWSISPDSVPQLTHYFHTMLSSCFMVSIKHDIMRIMESQILSTKNCSWDQFASTLKFLSDEVQYSRWSKSSFIFFKCEKLKLFFSMYIIILLWIIIIKEDTLLTNLIF